MATDVGVATVALGLASAISWGAADFGGGAATRRAPVLGVALLVQPVGVAAALLLALAFGEPAPVAGAVLLAGAAGVAGAVALVNLYQGLATGRMGVVAPLSGFLAAMLPVGAGIVITGFPSATVLLGLLLGLAAVVLVSRTPDGDARRTGAEHGIAAGLAFGVYNVLVSQLPGATLFGSLAVAKLAAAVVIGLIVLAGRRAWRVDARSLPLALTVGVLNIAGNALFVVAAHAGRLDVAAVLASLYPVVTVILAASILGEQVSRVRLLGIAAAVLAIALIASGSITA